MKKKISILLVIILVMANLASCNISPNVEKIENIDGEDVKILKGENENTPRGNKSNIEDMYNIEQTKLISEGEYAWYLDMNNVLVIRSNSKNNYDIVKINLSTLEENIVIKNQEGINFKISPDKKNILYVTKDLNRAIILDIERSVVGKEVDKKMIFLNESLRESWIEWLDRENEVYESSISWADDENILYSDLGGNIYLRNINNDEAEVFLTDSVYKSNIRLIDDKLLYLKREWEWQKDRKNGDVENYNSLAYSPINGGEIVEINGIKNKQLSLNTIPLGNEELNLTSYKISPDYSKIALYFDDEISKKFLYTIVADGSLFSGKGFKKELVKVSNSLSKRLVWSKDSKAITYSDSWTGEKLNMKSLYIKRLDLENSDDIRIFPIVLNDEYLAPVNLEWNEAGNSLLCVEEIDNKFKILEVKFK